MFLLTLRDLSYRATRFVVVIVMGAVVFALLFVMTGLVEQFNTEPYDTVHQMGADDWVVAAGISGP
jgi:putative ABC transport system permease protein